MDKKEVIIYTDGACSGNPGVGGWGAILMYGNYRKELKGFEAETTNNRMELMGVICALEQLKYPCKAEIYSDSAYTVNGFSEGWVYGWERSNWRKADGKEVLNQELWQRLLALTRTHEVAFHKVKGHADNEHNNRCDFLAREAIAEYKKSISTPNDL